MTTFLFAIWLGGINEAFAAERAAGRGALFASWKAFFWPLGLGRCLAAQFYQPEPV